MKKVEKEAKKRQKNRHVIGRNQNGVSQSISLRRGTY
jgi:hypothetical protein